MCGSYGFDNKWLDMNFDFPYMFRLKRVLLFCCVGMAFKAHATVLNAVSVEELYEKADVVALVQVISGRQVVPLDDDCGSEYTGRIIRQVKGGELGGDVIFGYSDGFRIGMRYLLFLSKPSTEYRSLSSTNSISMRLEKEVYDKCGKLWKGMKVMHDGQGAMLLDRPGYDAWAVKIPSRFVALPSTFKATPIPPATPDDFYIEPVWVLESEIFNLFETFPSHHGLPR